MSSAKKNSAVYISFMLQLNDTLYTPFLGLLMKLTGRFMHNSLTIKTILLYLIDTVF